MPKSNQNVPRLGLTRNAKSLCSKKMTKGIAHRRPMAAIVRSFRVTEIMNEKSITNPNAKDDMVTGQRLVRIAIHVIVANRVR